MVFKNSTNSANFLPNNLKKPKNKGHISVMNRKICPATYNNLHLDRVLFDFLRRSPHFGLYNFYDILLVTPLIKVCKITYMVLHFCGILHFE